MEEYYGETISRPRKDGTIIWILMDNNIIIKAYTDQREGLINMRKIKEFRPNDDCKLIPTILKTSNNLINMF